jgi:hypothetical protein
MTEEPTLYELMDGTNEEKNLAEDYVALLDKAVRPDRCRRRRELVLRLGEHRLRTSEAG